ncbi:MAG: glycosyltransferase [Candidatus Xenobia bacterium]
MKSPHEGGEAELSSFAPSRFPPPLARALSRYYHQQLRTLYRKLISPGSRVLEIGCGHADLLAAMEPARGVGIEREPKRIEVGRKRHPDLDLRCADAMRSLPAETFDFIILADLLVHVDDVQGLLEALRGCCEDHTRIIITSHNAAWQWLIGLAERSGLKPRSGGANWLGSQDLLNLCKLAGYAVEKSGTSVLLPVHLPGLSDAMNRRMAPHTHHLNWIQYLVATRAPRPAPPPLRCSVIVPTRNEVGNIDDCVRRIPDMGSGTEIIFVDGSSTDGTIEAIEAAVRQYPERSIRLIHQVPPETELTPGLRRESARVQRTGKMLPQGKADAVRKGFAAASGDVLMILDADLTVAPEELPRFYQAIADGTADFVNGSRLLYPMESGAMKFTNLLGNKFFSLLFSWLLGQYVKDTLCGTKVLRKADYENVIRLRQRFGDFDPFGDFELLFGASAAGLRIVDLPIRYRRRIHGIPKIENLRHTPLLFKMAWRGFMILKLRARRRSN